MIFSLPRITQFMAKGLETFKHFPLTLLSSLLTTVIASYFIAFEPDELNGINLILAKLAITAMLSVFVFTALRLLEYSLAKHVYWVVLGLGFVGLIVYYSTLPNDMHGFDAWVYAFRHIFLMILFFIAILWVPFVKSPMSNSDYWEYAKSVMLALLMTINFTIVIVLGVNVALYAIEELFSLEIKGKYYFIVDIFIIGVFSVGYFLSQIHKDPLSIKAILPPPRIEKFFTQYVLTPLTGLYFIILYAYTAKVLVSMDWPKGMLAWLIVAFSVVAVITYLFWTHFRRFDKSKWCKWIWLAILLQTFMLFVAIGMRVDAYSWTENRYMVVLLGVWLAGISLYFLLRKEAKIKYIFVSLSVLLAISQVGPLSAYSVSKKAQITRLMNAVESYNQEKSFGKDVPIKMKYHISDITQYLYTRYGISIFEPLFPKIIAEFVMLDAKKRAAEKDIRQKIKMGKTEDYVVTQKGNYQKVEEIFKERPDYFPYFLTYELGFTFVNAWDYNNGNNAKIKNSTFIVRHCASVGQKAQDIRGYDYIARYYGDSYGNGKKAMNSMGYFENIGINITFERHILKIQKDKKSIVIDMDAYVQKLIKKYGLNPKNLTQKDLTLEKENELFKVKIEFQHLNQNNNNGKKNLNFNAVILFKMKGEK